MRAYGSPKKVLPYEAALQRLRDYCAAAERPSRQVYRKALGYGLEPDEAQRLVAQLQTETYLSDERYAGSLVRSRHSYRAWGQRKIVAKLRQEAIAQPLIEEAMAQIPTEDFDEALRTVLEKKLRGLREPDPHKRKARLFRAAAAKGYSAEAIMRLLPAGLATASAEDEDDTDDGTPPEDFFE